MSVAVRDVEPSELSMWGDIPAGYRLEWHPAAGNRPATVEEAETRRCRRPRCGGVPVMALQRGFGDRRQWWLYCADHMYGRRIRDGVVEMRRLVKDEKED